MPHRNSDKNNPLNFGNLLAATVILTLGLTLALPTINSFPAFIHAWSQSDWYSLAIGFQNNGFDLFHPETLIYNKQYPGWWAVDNGDTLTSVDFPIHNYIVALLMNLFGTTAPWVFRGWTLLCSLAGAWFIYQIGRRLTGSVLKAIAVVMVYMTAPVYAYYFASYLPCAPSMALVAAGLWAYVCHWQEGRQRYWHLAMALLAMAALVRTSQLVVLVAVCLFEVLRIIRKEERIGTKWLSLIAALGAIAAYHLWNNHLSSQHGTLFLSTLDPPQSWSDVGDILDNIRERWQWSYFSRLQHWLIAITIGLAAITLLRGKKGANGSTAFGWLGAIWWVGELCFFVAMMGRFKDHDYYFLDSLFLPCIFLFIMALRALPNHRGILSKAALTVGLVALGIVMLNHARRSNEGRCTTDDRAYQCSVNYEGADKWLDELGISRDARILSVFSYPQNSPFIQMGRKGYTLMWFDKEIVDAALEFPFDYAVVEDEVFRMCFEPHTRLLGRLQRIAGNGHLSLCTLADSIVNPTADDFFTAEGYVSIRHGHFAIDGKRWFPVMLNYKAEMKERDGELAVVPAPWYTGGDIGSHFDTIAAWGFNAVRVCLDRIDRRDDTAAMYRATQRMVQQAASAGLHVMLLIEPPLDDYWRQYTIGLMKRLADQPALWAYDLMNEPLYFDPEKERSKESAAALVKSWRKMVRQYAPNQLFTVALAEPIEVFEWDPSLLPVDFIEMHTYHPLRVRSEMWWYSHHCGKPWMIGETGLPADGDRVPYEAQARFMLETYRYATQLGAIGYGWWEFQDYPEGVNFEAQYTGLRDSEGRRKPAVATVGAMQHTYPEQLFSSGVPCNYYNMLAYANLATTGVVVDQQGKPIDGAVIRGWNKDWSVGINTFSDSTGRFRLVSNDVCTHFEISAPGYSKVKFDQRVKFPATDKLPEQDREYQQLPLLGWGPGTGILPQSPKQFEAPTAVEASIGTIKLSRL